MRNVVSGVPPTRLSQTVTASIRASSDDERRERAEMRRSADTCICSVCRSSIGAASSSTPAHLISCHHRGWHEWITQGVNEEGPPLLINGVMLPWKVTVGAATFAPVGLRAKTSGARAFRALPPLVGSPGVGGGASVG